MIVYVLGGFLGSGKTTLLMRMASEYLRRGKNVTILVNEMGEIGVDGTTMKSKGYNAVELPNGCICCSLSETLQTAVQEIKKDIDPDVMLVEPTGLAFPHKVREIIQSSIADPGVIEIIGVIDCPRFDLLLSKKEEFFKTQIRYADHIIVNKTDMVPAEESDRIISWVKNEFSGHDVHAISGKTGDGIDELLAGLII